ncbi:hypothetical protein LRP50_18200 [Enterovibrio sp. ZSDZ42]|uniref:Peptidoglycan binding-like domain-containing protein n=1 Tax=Enterovibrio gelatinilyticus TaxID=2899819 RepID=A0ABT5R483_9GAMM|nr:hypothetical protein [Enterovibrio sp. ZSDZ42]MDD1795063.1 hypothetical protein [Enterovibrio sp. ZSDZ42]
MTRKTKLSGASVGKVFGSAIEEIIRTGKRLNFKGEVDLGVTLNTSISDETGVLLVLFKGNDSTSKNMQVKLATRIRLSDLPPRYEYKKPLRKNYKGQEVMELQAALNRVISAGLKEDGKYGTETIHAVKTYRYSKNTIDFNTKRLISGSWDKDIGLQLERDT